jgi:transcriptional regulator with XRE-family HTH domain
MKDIDYVEIGKRIKSARKNLKLTQEKLAEKVEVAPSYISEIERGTSICSLAVLVKIADILKLNLDNLVCGINESNVNDTFKELLNRIPKEKHKLFVNLCSSIADTLSEK